VSTKDFETSIADFLALGRRLQAARPLTGQQVLDELTAWYRDTRIEGAAVDEDADMLLLQWGATTPQIVSEPTDLRNLSDDDLAFADQESQYLDFTRQVFVAGEDDEEEEFDDAAVQMSIMLAFEPADGNEPSSNQWISSPDEIENGIKTFVHEPYVRSLLSAPAKLVSITVSHCG
jgi:hypothetical protein